MTFIDCFQSSSGPKRSRPPKVELANQTKTKWNGCPHTEWWDDETWKNRWLRGWLRCGPKAPMKNLCPSNHSILVSHVMSRFCYMIWYWYLIQYRLPIGDYRGSLLPHTRAVKCGSAKSTVQWEYHPAEWLWCHVFRKKLPRGFVGDWVSTLKSEQPQQGLWGVELKNPTKSPLMSEEVSSRNWWRFPNLLTGGWRFDYFCCKHGVEGFRHCFEQRPAPTPDLNPQYTPPISLGNMTMERITPRWNPWQLRSHTVRPREEQRASEGHKTLQRVPLLPRSRAFRLEQGRISAVSNSRTKCFTRAIMTWKRCLEVHLQTAWQLVAFSRLLFTTKECTWIPWGSVLMHEARSGCWLCRGCGKMFGSKIYNHNTWQCPRITMHIPVRGWTKEIHLQLKHELRETGEKITEEKFASKMQAPMISTGCPWCERSFPRAQAVLAQLC